MDEPEDGVCPQCGAPLSAGQRFCGQCGSERPHEADAPAQGGLSWEADIGLVTNPLILRQLVTAPAIAGLIMFALLSFIFAVAGEWESIPMILFISLLTAGALAALMLLVAVLFFGNRFRARFAVDEKGFSVETVDRRARAANRLAVAMGVLGRNPGPAGAGVAGMARERESYSWRGIAAATYHPGWRGIALRNHWRTVAFLACTPTNYEQVAACVRAHVAPRSSRPARNPLPRFLGRSALVMLASLPVFLLPYPFELDLLVPLLMVSFALATVWLLPVFGWVVIGAALWIAAEIALIALGTRESMFASLGTYRTYEILDTADWLALALAAAGLAYLAISSWRAARGHLPSLLSEDYAEAEE